MDVIVSNYTCRNCHIVFVGTPNIRTDEERNEKLKNAFAEIAQNIDELYKIKDKHNYSRLNRILNKYHVKEYDDRVVLSSPFNRKIKTCEKLPHGYLIGTFNTKYIECPICGDRRYIKEGEDMIIFFDGYR
jgi:DNA-directed RNA polymerase subunit RPC12/RpoP